MTIGKKGKLYIDINSEFTSVTPPIAFALPSLSSSGCNDVKPHLSALTLERGFLQQRQKNKNIITISVKIFLIFWSNKGTHK